MSDLKRNLIDIVGYVADIESQNISDFENTTLEELGVDSLMGLEIAVHLEREYSIRFNEDELSQMENLQSILDLLNSKGIKE